MMKRIYYAREIRGAYEDNMNKFCNEAVENGWMVQEFHSHAEGRLMILFYKDVDER